MLCNNITVFVMLQIPTVGAQYIYVTALAAMESIQSSRHITQSHNNAINSQKRLTQNVITFNYSIKKPNPLKTKSSSRLID